ncbi:MAG: hypothetical protein AAF446_09045 [Pseudomonadota bacterium]
MTNHHEVSLWRQTILPSLSLFTSVGTLICCALPALLVTIGMGASLAGLIGAAPWITVISEYKGVVFVVAAGLLLLAVWMHWRSRHAPCPADPAKAIACKRLRRFSSIILGSAVAVYVVGFFFAFVAVRIFY